ncbi:hypothetical protein KDW_53370 [Dictyobacter vulcani]|uniref:Uncharacterized protein n=1 Tax=Dictyobacter vulcani TaxID=2607529 RepID=A0A5J4KTF4_9CHLR|nr:hypothetical protein [Dictyobacter vulcani]GER91175.1 hypothetical protein KDW_53370 [Dictyobacter vulcani]
MLIRNGVAVLASGPARLDIRTRGEILIELAEHLTLNLTSRLLRQMGYWSCRDLLIHMCIFVIQVVPIKKIS